MSSLMVSNDLDIMMLEFAVEKVVVSLQCPYDRDIVFFSPLEGHFVRLDLQLFVPKTSIFDDVITKRTTVMFRMLDHDWTPVNPNRTDYAPYTGSNLEEENFHGGKSIVFAIPSDSLERNVDGVDIQIHVRKNISRHFEMDSCQNVGVALANVDSLFNGIIKELREREELKEHLSCLHKRQPISRSLKESYRILDENQRVTGASISLFVRLSYFGKSITTEIDRGSGIRRAFYAQEETNEACPYQWKELKRSDLEGGCWGSETFLSPVRPDKLACNCDRWKSVCEQSKDDSDYGDDDGGRSGGQADRDAKYPTARGSVDGKSRRSNGDRAGPGRRKSGGKGGKKYRAVNETVDNESGVENGKRKISREDKNIEKGVVEVGEGGRREADGPGKGIQPDRMEIFKDERESIKDVYTLVGDNRRGDAEEIERKTAKGGKRTGRHGDGGSPSSDIKRHGRSTSDDDARASGRAKGQVGAVRKVGKTGGAYVDDKRRKKRTDGINAPVGKVEKVESVKDERTKEDFKDQKALVEESRAQGAVTPTMVADRVGLPGSEFATDAKEMPHHTGGSMTTSEYVNRLKQLRRRRRGIVTVGLDDREKKICQDAPSPTLLKPTSPIPSATMPLGLCSNMHYRSPCWYTWPFSDNALLYLPQACVAEINSHRQRQLFTGLNPANMAEMEILTN